MDFLYYLFGFGLLSSIGGPLLIIGGIVAVVLSIKHYKKIPSPEESEKVFWRFKKEIDKLKTEGFISQDQAERIIEKYQALAGKREAKRRQRMVMLFSTFGSILIGLGVILLIAANWSKMPPFVATCILILATFGVYFAAWWFKYKKRSHPKIGEALIFLGSLLFGASLILIAQLYHIRIEYSNLILVWALALLPLVYFTKSSLTLALSSLLIIAWGNFSLAGSLSGFSRDSISFPWQYYCSLVFLLVLAVPLAYRLKSPGVQALNLVEIMSWFGPIASLKWFKGSENIVLDICLLFLAMGIGIFLLGELHSRLAKYQNFRSAYYPLGLLVTFTTCFILTFPQVYNITRAYGAGRISNTSFMPVFFNFVLFGAICGAIYLGIRKEENSFVNMAVFFFALLVFARYFSVSWSLSTRSFIFMAGGVLLIAGAYFIDMSRKKLLKQVGPNNNNSL